jgi:hypothetical protein
MLRPALTKVATGGPSPMFGIIGPPSRPLGGMRLSHTPEKSGLPLACRGAGALRLGVPSALRGTSERTNAGRNMQGGLPYTPWAAELRRKRMSTFSQDNPDANCLPAGLMQQHTHSQPRSIVHTKDDILIAYEANGGLRHIFLDGRSLPANDPQPWWQGYSVGHWDGDTLVVESTGFRDDGWLDVDGSYFGTTTKISERFRRVNYGRLELDITVEDAKAYTRPWTVRVNYRLLPDQQLIEFVCNENEQSSKHFIKP